MNGKNINFKDKKMEAPKSQWLKDLARDNLKRETEMQNRRCKKDAKPHDIYLYLIHNKRYKQKHELKDH